jgi:hypothetical protein
MGNTCRTFGLTMREYFLHDERMSRSSSSLSSITISSSSSPPDESLPSRPASMEASLRTLYFWAGSRGSCGAHSDLSRIMRKDDDTKNAQLQLEIAVRDANAGLILEALRLAWDDNMEWQDELRSSDIARVTNRRFQPTPHPKELFPRSKTPWNCTREMLSSCDGVFVPYRCSSIVSPSSSQRHTSQAIVAEEIKDNTSRQYSVQSMIRVRPISLAQYCHDHPFVSGWPFQDL